MKRKFVYILLGLSLFWGACDSQDFVEVKESTEPVEMFLRTVTEFYSTFDVLDDFISTEELLGKKDERLLPNSVQFVVTDSSFTDGDGISAYLDFGDLGAQAPYGVLCKDNKYRAGRIYFMLNLPYSYPLAQLNIIFDSDKAFHSGDGTDMMKFEGDFTIGKFGPHSIILKSSPLKLTDPTGHTVDLLCNNVVEKYVDNSRGVMNDEIGVKGDFTLKDGSVTYVGEVSEALRKNYTPSCISNFISGVFTFESSNSHSEIEADFDPFDNQECDNLVSVTINNKRSILTY